MRKEVEYKPEVLSFLREIWQDEDADKSRFVDGLGELSEAEMFQHVGERTELGLEIYKVAKGIYDELGEE